MYFTVISPTDTFRRKPYFVVFWLAMSIRISGLGASIPNVKIKLQVSVSYRLEDQTSIICWISSREK